MRLNKKMHDHTKDEVMSALGYGKSEFEKIRDIAQKTQSESNSASEFIDKIMNEETLDDTQKCIALYMTGRAMGMEQAAIFEGLKGLLG
jgi:hypothetical protein